MPDLWGVLLGGILGWGGSAVQFYLHERRAKEERRSKRAEKFEELVAAVYAHAHWLEEVRNERVFEYKINPGMSPWAKVEALRTAYFPEFDEAMYAVSLAAKQYEAWTVEAGAKRASGVAKFTEDHLKYYKAYLDAFGTLMNEFRAFAKHEFRGE